MMVKVCREIKNKKYMFTFANDAFVLLLLPLPLPFVASTAAATTSAKTAAVKKLWQQKKDITKQSSRLAIFTCVLFHLARRLTFIRPLLLLLLLRTSEEEKGKEEEKFTASANFLFSFSFLCVCVYACVHKVKLPSAIRELTHSLTHTLF